MDIGEVAGASGDFYVHCRATFWSEGCLIDWGREVVRAVVGEEGLGKGI